MGAESDPEKILPVSANDNERVLKVVHSTPDTPVSLPPIEKSEGQLVQEYWDKEAPEAPRLDAQGQAMEQLIGTLEDAKPLNLADMKAKLEFSQPIGVGRMPGIPAAQLATSVPLEAVSPPPVPVEAAPVPATVPAPEALRAGVDLGKAKAEAVALANEGWMKDYTAPVVETEHDKIERLRAAIGWAEKVNQVPVPPPAVAPAPETRVVTGRAYAGGPTISMEVANPVPESLSAPVEAPVVLEAGPAAPVAPPQPTGSAESQPYQVVAGSTRQSEKYAQAIQLTNSKFTGAPAADVADASFNELSALLLEGAETAEQKLAAKNDLLRLTGRGGEVRIEPAVLSGADATMENRIRTAIRAFNHFGPNDPERREGTLEVGGKRLAFTIAYVDAYDHNRIVPPNGSEARIVNVRAVRS